MVIIGPCQPAQQMIQKAVVLQTDAVKIMMKNEMDVACFSLTKIPPMEVNNLIYSISTIDLVSKISKQFSLLINS